MELALNDEGTGIAIPDLGGSGLPSSRGARPAIEDCQTVVAGESITSKRQIQELARRALGLTRDELASLIGPTRQSQYCRSLKLKCLRKFPHLTKSEPDFDQVAWLLAVAYGNSTSFKCLTLSLVIAWKHRANLAGVIAEQKSNRGKAWKCQHYQKGRTPDYKKLAILKANETGRTDRSQIELSLSLVWHAYLKGTLKP